MEIIAFQDKKYVVKLKTADVGFPAEKLEWYKFYKDADTVLKKDGLLYFVDTMEEIQVEVISDNS